MQVGTEVWKVQRCASRYVGVGDAEVCSEVHACAKGCGGGLRNTEDAVFPSPHHSVSQLFTQFHTKDDSGLQFWGVDRVYPFYS